MIKIKDPKIIRFNKELIFGESGALLFAPLFGLLSSFIHNTPHFISSFTLLGSILGGSTIWAITRIHDEKKYGKFSIKKFGSDLSFYTPIAILISISVVYPTIFFVTSIIVRKHIPYVSSLIGELSGFTVFLFLINGYRYLLKQTLNKEL